MNGYFTISTLEGTISSAISESASISVTEPGFYRGEASKELHELRVGGNMFNLDFLGTDANLNCIKTLSFQWRPSEYTGKGHCRIIRHTSGKTRTLCDLPYFTIRGPLFLINPISGVMHSYCPDHTILYSGPIYHFRRNDDGGC